jgi:hypothetical protein
MADSTVFKRVAAQRHAMAAVLCAFEAGNLDLPSARADPACIGLGRGESRK